MNPHKNKSSWNDFTVEQIIGNLLRIGVLTAAGIVIIGGIIYLIRFGHSRTNLEIFHGEPADLRTVGGIVKRAFTLSGRGLIQLGLLVLIATPVARVAFSLVAFILERDRNYIIITLVVLSILLFSLMGGRL
ncbi:MAG: DUF1634 domain-containing protein [Phycisphaerae bacterium]